MKKYIFFLCLTILQSYLFGQWSITQWNQPRVQISGASNDQYLFIPGGVKGLDEYPQDVAVYNVVSDQWTSMPLSTPRAKIAAVANDSLLFCAGGMEFFGFTKFSAVDIYDLRTLTPIRKENLSQARTEISAVMVGSKVIFAGGVAPEINPFLGFQGFFPTDVVDIYDLKTQTWSTANLSEARGGMAHAVIDGKAFFAGGVKENGIVSDVVDVYDANTDSWSTLTLPVGRAFYGGGIGFDGKAYFAGGILGNNTVSDRIEIYDPATDSWTLERLSEARATIQAAATDNTVIFACGAIELDLPSWLFFTGSDIIDYYNKSTRSWNKFESGFRRLNHATLASNNQVFVLGGVSEGGGLPPNGISVFQDNVTTNLDQSFSYQDQISIYPNPVESLLHMSISDPNAKFLKLIDSYGKTIYVAQVRSEIDLDLTLFPAGLYHLVIFKENSEIFLTKKILKAN